MLVELQKMIMLDVKEKKQASVMIKNRQNADKKREDAEVQPDETKIIKERQYPSETHQERSIKEKNKISGDRTHH